MYILLSILSAFGQASTWAYKKKSLDLANINNTLGFTSFFVASIILLLLWLVFGGSIEISNLFISSTAVVILVNVIALLAGYKAMQIANYSDLMPLMALSTLGIVPLEYMLRNTMPSVLQIIGIGVIVLGSIISMSQWPSIKNKSALIYFGVTVLCYTIAPPFMAIAVVESGSALFSASVFHFFISIAFLPLIVLSKELALLKVLHKEDRLGVVLQQMIRAGILTSLIENGPATLALQYANASIVFSIKRVMPSFALLLGNTMFKETITKTKIASSILLIVGAVIILLG